MLLAKLGGPQSYIQIDLGFNDIVEPISHSLNLTATSKGPLFESQIQVRSYPKEFIFAEKLETVVHRGIGNSRMKDFHDLISLISLDGCLDRNYADKVVKAVFLHRETPIKALPIQLDYDAAEVLQSAWQNYREKTFSLGKEKIPNAIKDVIELINTWLKVNTSLCEAGEP